ncbi:Endoplasmic reticulum-based factor for assembly of V-ATPase [Plasmodiophora brassicae]|uniref:Uncharacterized protein n=1 Tax=Plasmodiophora brassicae TaxID=37360 RepID=A0A0G4J1P8_PLABS|nr:hypothetical protein PBRA_002049 [Plasmodiophora brassicae]
MRWLVSETIADVGRRVSWHEALKPGDYVEQGDLVRLCKRAREMGVDSNMYLHTIAKSSDIEPGDYGRPSRPRSSSFAARLDELRRKQDAIAYRQMVGMKADRDEARDLSLKATDRRAISMGVNMIASMITAMVAGYTVGQSMHWSPVASVCTGLVAVLGIVTVEAWLLVIRESRLD